MFQWGAQMNRIKKILKWIAVAVGSLLGLVVIALTIIFFYMEHRFDEVHEIPGTALVIPDDAASIAEGERLARIRGCNNGCHGDGASGGVFFEIPDGTRVVAPDLGRLAQTYSVADFERAIRHGVSQDGTSVIGIMPSSMLYNLNDGDLTRIIAYLRAQSPSETIHPSQRLGPAIRAMLMYFERTEDWDILAAAGIDHDAPRPDAFSEDPRQRGEYLASTSCSECHTRDLRGSADGTPSLAIVAAYSLENFHTLMRTGVPIGGRELDLMKDMGIKRFSHFTDPEVDDLYAYLQTLATTAE